MSHDEEVDNTINHQSWIAERSLLGGCMKDPDWVPVLAGQITPEDFYRTEHSELWALLVQMDKDGIPIDALISVPDRVMASGEPWKFGGLEYVVELPDKVPATANLRYYAELIAGKAACRRLIHAMSEWREIALRAEDPDALFSQVSDELGKIRRPTRHGSVWLAEAARQHLDENEKLWDKGAAPAIRTRYPDIDRYLRMVPEDLVVLAARPSMGKTALALNLLMRLAKAKVPVGIFSMEMGRRKLMDRFLTSLSGIDLDKIQEPPLWTQKDWDRIVEVEADIAEQPIRIDTRPALTIDQIRAEALRWVVNHGIRVIVVDYLGLMPTPLGKRAEATGLNAAGLKQIAKDLNILVIAIHQLNRKVEERTDKFPIMSDLKDSGDIEQHADAVLFVHRPIYYNRNHADKREAFFIIAKQRQGQRGVRIRLEWWGETQVFRDYRSLEQRRKEAAERRGLSGQREPLEQRGTADSEDADEHDGDGVESGEGGRRGRDQGGPEGRRGSGGQAELDLGSGGDAGE